MNSTSHPFLQLIDICHGFTEAGNRRDVLRGISLQVEAGEHVALIGQSGSGKSTLMHLIGGLDIPQAGQILFGEIELNRQAEPERTFWRRKYVGFVYQFFNLIPTLTVMENVLLPLELNQISDEPGRMKAMNLLAEVGLSDRADSYPDRLSGGEQQRIAIIRALIHNPCLVLADEPTGNLDTTSGDQVLELLDRLVRKQGHTLILVTHSMEVAKRADRIVSLVDGRLSINSSL